MWVQRFYIRYVRPQAVNEDDRRKEFILNVLLCGTLALSTVATAAAFYRALNVAMLGGTVMVIWFAALLALSRKGFFVFCEYALVFSCLAAASYAQHAWGVDTPGALLVHVLAIMIASTLVGVRFGLVVASLSCCTTIALGYGFMARHQPPEREGIMEYVGLLLLITLACWLSNREAEHLLSRARTSEEMLRKERDLLEATIDQRTQEVKRVQLEKISQLYRFAEFGRLASGLFHDLMNHLTAVTLNLKQARTEKEANVVEAKAYLQRSVRSAERLEGFIEAVRKQMYVKEATCRFLVEAEIMQVLQLLRYKAMKAGVKVLPTLNKAIELNGDRIKFHQIVANLVSNAIDSYDGLPIVPRYRKVLVKSSRYSGQIYISIQDGGQGIKNEDQEKVFEPFFTTKPFEKGTGIGLSNVRRIVEKDFNGSVWVKSTYGEGSTFYLKIPNNT